MAAGGFKLNKYEWTGTGTGNEEDRLDSVLSNIVEAICTNTDWIMDDNIQDSTTDYAPSDITMQCLPYKNETHYNKICFLTNGNLFLALGLCSGQAKLKPSDLVYTVNTSGSGSSAYATNAIVGLYFSVSTTGDWDTSSVDYGVELPADATKWSSFGLSSGSSSSNTHIDNFVRDNIANVIYSYYFLTKDSSNFIAIFEKCSSWGANTLKGFIGGEIIGSLAHQSEDSNKNGCLMLFGNQGPTANATSKGESISPATSYTTGGNNYFLNQEDRYFVKSYNFNDCSQIFRSEEFIASATAPTPIPVPYDSTTNTGVGVSVSNPIQLGVDICNPITGGTRWCPLQAYIQSNDPVHCGVVENDGFKGYLDTDFIRAVTINEYALGSTFGVHKEFCYIGAGLAIGWDESITDSLF